MVWLPEGEKIAKIFLFVLAQLTNVTDRQTDGHRVTAIAALCIASDGKKTAVVAAHLSLAAQQCSSNYNMQCIRPIMIP